MKKKIVSMILALSLVISGLPVTAANAAELGENEFQQDESTNVDNTTEAAETESSTADETENVGTESGAIGNFEAVGVYNNATAFKAVSDASLSADYSRLHVDSNGKAVGSDGVTYDDVAYLSASTVMALDAEVQDDYIMLCDVAAKWAKDGIEDIVIAVDENGMLNWSCYVPGVLLAETQKELIEGALASETEAKESTETEESSEDKTPESEGNAEAVSTEDAGAEKTEAATDETTAGEESETQSVQEETETEKSEIEETATDGTETESSSTEESTVEETTTEGTTDESESTEENSTEAAATEEESTVEETTIEETAIEETSEEESTVEDVFVELSAENMDLIPAFVNEQVELADEVDVDVIDLGYGKVFNSTLPDSSYFSKQLTPDESKVYNAARGSLIAGNTTFSIPDNTFAATDAGVLSMIDAAARAISVVILTDTEKVEWFAIPGGFGIKGKLWYDKRTNKLVKTTVQIDKSEYYKKELDTAANAQVSKVVAAAQEYALKNYPASTAYGIVEYFDKWICENNYYNTPGGVQGILGGEVYYHCHSSYGALLKGYAVCESYAKAMSRLLDAVKIPNMYVTGYAYNDPVNGGHAWNYVQMPDGKWYLLDSTWNNPSTSAANASQTSTKDYLLAAGDTDHTPTGEEYNNMSRGFNFVPLSNSRYIPTPEAALKFKEGTVMPLAVKEKGALTLDGESASYAITGKGTWSSSNVKIAKVDKNGKITAVAPGTAIISYSSYVAGIEKNAECVINVYQVKALTSANTGKASDSVSLETEKKIPGKVKLNVNVGDTPYTAEYMAKQSGFKVSGSANAKDIEAPEVSYTKQGIVTADIKWDETGNCLDVEIKPVATGSTKVNVSFGGKKVTITAAVSEKLIDKAMYTIDWEKAKVANGTIDYTGKAVKPAVKKAADAPKDFKFKATYVNNINAGTATVKISGMGKYGGEICETFKIKKKDISGAVVTGIKNQVYNGGVNPVPAVVKVDKKKLVANKDYEIYYNNVLTSPIGAGKYKLVIKGKGNYEGVVTQSLQDYEITKNTIDKISITCAKATYTGGVQNPVTVKIGKNIVPSSEYTVKFYDAKDTKRSNELSPILKGSYMAVVTVKDGSNNLTTGKKTEQVKKFSIK